MRVRALLGQSLIVGAVGGLLLEALVLRLNPEVGLSAAAEVAAAAAWAVWGVIAVGLPLALLLTLVHRGVRRLRWPVFWLVPATFLVAGGVSRLNADLHPQFLSGTAHRMLGQDAVAWLGAAIVAAALGAWTRRRPERPVRWAVYVVVVLALAPARLLLSPSPLREPPRIAAEPLGVPGPRLVVAGIEGLDGNFLLAHLEGGRYPTLERLLGGGVWGPLAPYQPYLMRSLWTSLATGTLPRSHGVRWRWAWRLPFGAEPLRLLPRTPFGSEWSVPPLLARRVSPPPALIPPLWERLEASGVPAAAVGWTGVWPGPARPLEPPPGSGRVDEDLRRSLEAALRPFPRAATEIRAAIERDAARLALVRGLDPPPQALFVELRALGVARRLLEPHAPRDTAERAVVELVLELVDEQLRQLLAGPAPMLAVVVSPYGLDPPDSWERLKRLLGAGGAWRTSAQGPPDGVLVLRGPGVVAGRRFRGAQVQDFAPTVCYLLGLPVAQYMEGRVILEAVEPSYLAATPLRVVD